MVEQALGEVISMTTTPSTSHHGMHWLPQTQFGRWATTSVAAALGVTIALSVAFAAGMERPDTFADSWLVTVAGAATLIGSAAATATGVLAMTRRHDCSWLVAGATGVGLLLSVLMLQQVAEGLGWLSA